MKKKIFLICVILIVYIFTSYSTGNCNDDPDPGLLPPEMDLNVPVPGEQKDNCLIRISEISSDLSDVSDSVFTVTLPGS